MSTTARGEIRWGRRVPKWKIRRLYELDARGIVDEELIDDVGVTVFERCRSILTMREDTEQNRLAVGAYADPARDIGDLIDVGLFAGWLQNDRLPLAYRLVIKAIGEEKGDYRDWSGIEAWATEVAPVLARG